MNVSNVALITNHNLNHRLFSKPAIAIAVALTIIAALGAYLFYKGYFSFAARANPSPTILSHSSSISKPSSLEGVSPVEPVVSESIPLTTSIKCHLMKSRARIVLVDSKNQVTILPSKTYDAIADCQADYFQFDSRQGHWVAYFKTSDSSYDCYDISNDGARLRKYQRANIDHQYPLYSGNDLFVGLSDLQKKCVLIEDNLWIPKEVHDCAKNGNASYIEITDREWRIIFENSDSIGYILKGADVFESNGEISKIFYTEPCPTSSQAFPIFYSLKKDKFFYTYTELMNS
jgi:hypothetical protein